MDTEIKHKYPLLKKYGWFAVAAVALTVAVVWAVVASGSSTYTADAEAMVTEDVTRGLFEDFVRLNGRVETGVVV